MGHCGIFSACARLVTLGFYSMRFVCGIHRINSKCIVISLFKKVKLIANMSIFITIIKKVVNQIEEE